MATLASFTNGKMDLSYSPEADTFFCNECSGSMRINRLGRQALALSCTCCGHSVDARLVNWSAARSEQAQYQAAIEAVAIRLAELADQMDAELTPRPVVVEVVAPVRKSWIARLLGR